MFEIVMRHSRRRVLLPPFALVTGLLLTACATAPPEVPDRASVRPAIVQPAAAPAEPVMHTAQPIHSYEEAAETAFRNNPRLHAAFARYVAGTREVPQASSLDDPTVMAEQTESFPGSGDMRENMLVVSQRLPWFGKRALRGELSGAVSRELLEEYRTEMLDIRRDVAESWYRLAFERADRALTLEDEALLQGILETTGTLYETGQADLSTLLRAQTELARLESTLPEFDSQIEVLENELVRLLGARPEYFQPVLAGPEDVLADLPKPEELIATAVRNHPELERYARQEEQGRLAKRLAGLDYYPDFTVGIGYAAMGNRPGFSGAPLPDDRTDAWMVSAGINLPIPNARRRAAKEQARQQTREAALRLQAREDEIVEQLYSAAARAGSLREQLAILESRVLPLAEEAAEAAEARYVGGQRTYLDMLDAQRMYVAVQRDLLRVRRDYLLAVADLERAAGGPLEMPHTEIFQ